MGRLREEVVVKSSELESARAASALATGQHHREMEEKEHTLQQVIQESHGHLLEKETTIERLQSRIKTVETELEEFRCQLSHPTKNLMCDSAQKLIWRQGAPLPEKKLTLFYGTVVAHKSIVYVSHAYSVYAYEAMDNKWSKLEPCRYEDFSLAVVHENLTTIGGSDNRGVNTNSLLCLIGSATRKMWSEVLPSMPMKRLRPAAATASAHLIVAGGRKAFFQSHLASVDVLNTDTLQWSVACSLPIKVGLPQIVLCGRFFYLSNSSMVFSCSVENLLKSCRPVSTDSSDCGSVWTRLADLPVEHGYSLATLGGRVLAIGGADGIFGRRPKRAIHSYDVVSCSWRVIGEMPTPRSSALAAGLPNDELVVAGGKFGSSVSITVTDIARFI